MTGHEDLQDLALRGLRTMYDPRTGRVPQTMRLVRTPGGVWLRPEGENLRYDGMVALGLSRAGDEAARSVVGEGGVTAYVRTVVERAKGSAELGEIALAAWCLGEICGEEDPVLTSRMLTQLGAPSVATVATSWALTATTSVPQGSAGLHEVRDAALARLLPAQGPGGLYPHLLPASGTLRAHVGSFADQVYPAIALARLSRARDDADALSRATRTVDVLCRLQGSAGQWWWHYDSRGAEVVERFPVYSVHQHAMGPMTLRDLREAGGPDRSAEAEAGVAWLEHHPESLEDLVSPRHSMIWRKVGRTEPPKAARAIGAAVTSLRPGTQVPGLDALLPPGAVDHECRPYELGWLLYAWGRS